MLTMAEYIRFRLEAELRARQIGREAEQLLTAEQWREICQAAGVPAPSPEFLAARASEPPVTA
jgi:hypothetical protein